MQLKTRSPKYDLALDLLLFAFPALTGFCFIMGGLLSGQIILGTVIGIGLIGASWRFIRLFDHLLTYKVKAAQEQADTHGLGD